MADKYIAVNDAGDAEQLEIEATVQSTGASEAGDIVALGADGRLDSSVMPAGFGDEAELVEAVEDLDAGEYVNVYDSGGGVRKARLADANSVGARATHFVLSNFTTGQNALCYGEGINNAVPTTLTIGKPYYCSETPGAVTNTKPTTSGAFVQRVGWSTETDTIRTEFGDTTERA